MQTVSVPEISRAISALFDQDDVVEVRALNTPKRTQIGFYNDRIKLIRDVASLSGKASGVYLVIDKVNPALLARSADSLHPYADSGYGTGDKDIVRRKWLKIDLDPVRPAGISSSDVEHDLALSKAFDVCDYLVSVAGFPSNSVLVADSGNGGHLLVRVDMPNDLKSSELVQKCLRSVAYLFNDGKITVDSTVHNPARIWKAYGTLSCKGSNTPERPHRIARLLVVPEMIEVAPEEALNKLAAVAPAEERDTSHSNGHYGGQKLDLPTWLASHEIVVTRVTKWETWDKYELEHCPFNEEHTGTSVCILQSDEGAIKFKCLHNGCQGKEWSDLRELKEPGYKANKSTATPADVEAWVKKSGGRWFWPVEIDRELGMRSYNEKEVRRTTLLRLEKDGVVERHSRNEQVRFINRQMITIDLKQSTEGSIPLRWAMGIEKLVNLFPGNLVVVAGVTNSGKTALLLNMIHLNQKHLSMPIYYFCSDTSTAELRGRLAMFRGIGVDEWNFTPVRRDNDFADVIVPDALNIVDYLKVSDKFWMVGDQLSPMSKKCGNGLTIVAIQKGEGEKWGRGREFGAEECKLYLTMDSGRITIVKGKSWANENIDPNGMSAQFSLRRGCEFTLTKEWHLNSGVPLSRFV